MTSARPATTRTYVLDTSVLLAEPDALGGFEEHEVVLPIVVLAELEEKRHHTELGWAARTVLRRLEDLRLAHGTLTEPVPVNEHGGTVRIEMNHADLAGLPEALRGPSNDHRILAVAHSLAAEGADAVLVTKDLPLRLRAAVVGLGAEEYRSDRGEATGWTGTTELAVSEDVIDRLYEGRPVELDVAKELPCNTGLILSSPSSSALARVMADKSVSVVRGDRHQFGVKGRSAEQRLALELLADPSVGIVSLGGSAGTGKSVLAIAAGLESVMERRSHKRVIVFRPLYAVGGQDLGYLPGSEAEKMAPWAAAVFDALESMVGHAVIEEVQRRRMLEVLPLTHIRGRTLIDSYVIIDEAQNLERTVLLTALSRLGENSKVVLTHDVAQRDNLRVGRNDGIGSVIESLKGHPLFAHITLTRSERSAIAALVTSVLEQH